MMTTLDSLVVVAYFVITIVAGVWFTKASAGGLRTYFLGDNKEKWWMLACSGSATNYSVEGTVANVSMLMALGMMSWYTTLVWWLPSTAVLIAFTAIWIRRTGAMTSADMNTVRFGVDTGAKAARVGFAVLIVTFSVMSLCMSYVVLHKFATVFGFPGHLSAMLLVGSTGLYVLFGGFRGVILTDFIQNVLLVVVSIMIGWICMSHYDAPTLEKAIPNQSLTIVQKLEKLDALKVQLVARNSQDPKNYTDEHLKSDLGIIGKETVVLNDLLAKKPELRNEKPSVMSFQSWNSLVYKPKPEMGRYKDSSCAGWGDFAGAALAWSIVGLIGSFGGAGGRYGEQRYLAAKTAKHAAWQAALWQCLAIPRWVVTAGLAFLGYAMFKEQTVEVVKIVGSNVIYCDPDSIFPLFTASNLLGPGMRGLVIATLAAAYMSTFSSEVNASASIAVHDIFNPLFEKDNDNAKGNMYASYAFTLAIVAAAMGAGYFFTEYSSLIGLWGWMLGGLICCIVIPLALRWYWGRMNGWGFAAGCVIGFLPSLCMLSKQFLPKDAWIQKIPDDYFTYAILTLSLLASVIVTYLTKPVEAKYIDAFYRKVRPFGFWGGIKERALASGEPFNAPLPLRWIPVNFVLALIAAYSLYMAPVYALGHWFVNAGIAFGIFLACAVIMYFTWFKKLPED
jgi:Na+/proline symporter